MKASSKLFAVQEPAAWDTLTDHQKMIVKLVTRPMKNGERRNISQMARELGVNRSTIYSAIRWAGLKFGDFAVAFEEHPGLEMDTPPDVY